MARPVERHARRRAAEATTMKLDPAARATAAALADDPFYRSITDAFASDGVRRRAVLEQYFSYSIQEGRTLGRTVHLPDPTQGVAVWLLPQSAEIEAQAARAKRAFLESTLGPRGTANYYRMVEYMSDRAGPLVGDDAWYLSIIAVDPALQGRGSGPQLLAPTLREADAVGGVTYLETFSPRNPRFYERLGFVTRARFDEPTTQAQYAVMVRDPRD